MIDKVRYYEKERNGHVTSIVLQRFEWAGDAPTYTLASKETDRDVEVWNLPFGPADHVWSAVWTAEVSFPDLERAGSWVSRHELYFDADGNVCSFRWEWRLPEEWASLQPIVDGLEDLKRHGRLHLVSLLSGDSDVLAFGRERRDGAFERAARLLCAYRHKVGSWPEVLYVPKLRTSALEQAFGKERYERLSRKLRIEKDSILTWAAWERIGVGVQHGVRLDYPAYGVGVDWESDPSFREWFGRVPPG